MGWCQNEVEVVDLPLFVPLSTVFISGRDELPFFYNGFRVEDFEKAGVDGIKRFQEVRDSLFQKQGKRNESED